MILKSQSGCKTSHEVQVLTNDLLVRAILAAADVDKVKSSLSACKTTNKVLEDAVVRNETFANKHITEALDIGVHAADNARLDWEGINADLSPLLHSCVEEGRCTEAARLALLDETVVELEIGQCC